MYIYIYTHIRIWSYTILTSASTRGPTTQIPGTELSFDELEECGVRSSFGSRRHFLHGAMGGNISFQPMCKSRSEGGQVSMLANGWLTHAPKGESFHAFRTPSGAFNAERRLPEAWRSRETGVRPADPRRQRGHRERLSGPGTTSCLPTVGTG